MEPIEGCPACGSLPIDWAGGANPHAFCADLKADNAALVEALQLISDGEGDADVIARQTLEELGLSQIDGGSSGQS